jgi:acetyl esterase/lipase
MKLLILAIVALVVVAIVVAFGGLASTAANVPALFGDFDRTGDIPYAAGDRHSLDVYRPHQAGPAPIVVFWYGGSWQYGKKERYRFVGAALASQGYVAVLPDYRVYPEVKFPGFVDDGAAAVAWVVNHAAEIGGDPRRVYLAGYSAGAHLAAMLAYDETRLTRAGVPVGTIRGFIGLAGPYALDPNDDTLRTIFSSPYTLADWQPVRFVTRDSPRALLIHGEADGIVAVRHAHAMAQTLAAAEVPVTLRTFPTRGHGDPIAGFASLAPDKLPVLEEIRAFIAAK